MYENQWNYLGEPFDSEHIGDFQGFVYRIENRKTGKLYIGKKNFWTPKTKMVNKKRKKFRVESDWKDYYGSNDDLKADVAKLGTKHFQRDIIRLCETKSEMSYFETKQIFLYDAILSEKYYNHWVSCKIRVSKSLIDSFG